jgi:outer membrane protein assembly factor BamB
LFFAGWGPGKSDSPFPDWESRVAEWDKDRDGKLSGDEFGWGTTMFKSVDTNGDGKLVGAEWNAILDFVKRGENVLLAVKPGGRGDITETHVAWKATRGLPYVPSPLFYDGWVYIVKDGGLISSFQSLTGEPGYAQERIPDAAGSYYASPVAADGRIYLASLQGKLTVLQAGGSQPQVLHQSAFGERIAATPALVGTFLYLRTAGHLFAFGP